MDTDRLLKWYADWEHVASRTRAVAVAGLDAALADLTPRTPSMETAPSAANAGAVEARPSVDPERQSNAADPSTRRRHSPSGRPCVHAPDPRRDAGVHPAGPAVVNGARHVVGWTLAGVAVACLLAAALLSQTPHAGAWTWACLGVAFTAGAVALVLLPPAKGGRP